MTTTRPFRPRFELSAADVEAPRREEILSDPGFGQHFTDHMVLAEWTPDDGWHDERIVPFGPLSLSPATAVLHYAQEVFEGLKAYRHEDGSVWTFRPDQNASRMQRSAARLALPQVSAAWFISSIDSLVATVAAWVPSGGGKSLYLRPFLFASEAFLGVRPAQHVTYAVIASPAGAYFRRGLRPVPIWLSEHYARAGSGGTGAAKCGGNYAASLLPQSEAAQHGCDQVAFLDDREHRYVEELGNMLLFFVYADGQIVTPASDSILEGITKDSICTIAGDLGHEVVERPFAIEEWRDGVASGRITEVFACGTAAVVTPVGRLAWSDGEAVSSNDGQAGPVTATIRRTLVDLQYGRADDPRGWMHRVDLSGQPAGSRLGG